MATTRIENQITSANGSREIALSPDAWAKAFYNNSVVPLKINTPEASQTENGSSNGRPTGHLSRTLQVAHRFIGEDGAGIANDLGILPEVYVYLRGVGGLSEVEATRRIQQAAERRKVRRNNQAEAAEQVAETEVKKEKNPSLFGSFDTSMDPEGLPMANTVHSSSIDLRELSDYHTTQVARVKQPDPRDLWTWSESDQTALLAETAASRQQGRAAERKAREDRWQAELLAMEPESYKQTMSCEGITKPDTARGSDERDLWTLPQATRDEFLETSATGRRSAKEAEWQREFRRMQPSTYEQATGFPRAERRNGRRDERTEIPEEYLYQKAVREFTALQGQKVNRPASASSFDSVMRREGIRRADTTNGRDERELFTPPTEQQDVVLEAPATKHEPAKKAPVIRYRAKLEGVTLRNGDERLLNASRQSVKEQIQESIEKVREETRRKRKQKLTMTALALSLIGSIGGAVAVGQKYADEIGTIENEAQIALYELSSWEWLKPNEDGVVLVDITGTVSTLPPATVDSIEDAIDNTTDGESSHEASEAPIIEGIRQDGLTTFVSPSKISDIAAGLESQTASLYITTSINGEDGKRILTGITHILTMNAGEITPSVLSDHARITPAGEIAIEFYNEDENEIISLVVTDGTGPANIVGEGIDLPQHVVKHSLNSDGSLFVYIEVGQGQTIYDAPDAFDKAHIELTSEYNAFDPFINQPVFLLQAETGPNGELYKVTDKYILFYAGVNNLSDAEQRDVFEEAFSIALFEGVRLKDTAGYQQWHKIFIQVGEDLKAQRAANISTSNTDGAGYESAFHILGSITGDILTHDDQLPDERLAFAAAIDALRNHPLETDLFFTKKKSPDKCGLRWTSEQYVLTTNEKRDDVHWLILSAYNAAEGENPLSVDVLKLFPNISSTHDGYVLSDMYDPRTTTPTATSTPIATPVQSLTPPATPVETPIPASTPTAPPDPDCARYKKPTATPQPTSTPTATPSAVSS